MTERIRRRLAAIDRSIIGDATQMHPPLPPPTSQMLTHWCSAHYLCNSLLSHIYNPNLRENITFCTMFCLLFLDPWVILSIVWKSIEIITFYWGAPNEESHMLAVLVTGVIVNSRLTPGKTCLCLFLLLFNITATALSAIAHKHSSPSNTTEKTH